MMTPTRVPKAERTTTVRLHTPTFEIGKDACVDFRPEKLKELLGIE